MTWSPGVCAWYWSGSRRSPIMPPWSKWCRCSPSSLSITRPFLLQPSSSSWSSKQTLCLWVLGNLLLWDVGVIFPSRNLLLCSNCVKMTLTFCVQLKKSGKEPKAGAELVCGSTTYKTKVCYNFTINFCNIKQKSVNHFHYMNVYSWQYSKYLYSNKWTLAPSTGAICNNNSEL